MNLSSPEDQGQVVGPMGFKQVSSCQCLDINLISITLTFDVRSQIIWMTHHMSVDAYSR